MICLFIFVINNYLSRQSNGETETFLPAGRE